MWPVFTVSADAFVDEQQSSSCPAVSGTLHYRCDKATEDRQQYRAAALLQLLLLPRCHSNCCQNGSLVCCVALLLLLILAFDVQTPDCCCCCQRQLTRSRQTRPKNTHPMCTGDVTTLMATLSPCRCTPHTQQCPSGSRQTLISLGLGAVASWMTPSQLN